MHYTLSYTILSHTLHSFIHSTLSHTQHSLSYTIRFLIHNTLSHTLYTLSYTHSLSLIHYALSYIGGDNSNSAHGNFYEGIMVTGATNDATDDAVQANIVAVGYKTIE